MKETKKLEIEVDVLKVTESAAAELKKAKEGAELGDEAIVRVAVTAGGCAGYQYALTFDNKTEESDFTFEQSGLTFAVDKKSVLFLEGTTLDWHEDLNARGFKFDNPLAAKSCGCGQSFQ